MPASPSCSQLAMLYNIGDFDHAAASDQERRDLEDLRAAGYVEPASESGSYQMTPLGLAFLRGELLEAAE